jgi:hypothetical protein
MSVLCLFRILFFNNSHRLNSQANPNNIKTPIMRFSTITALALTNAITISALPAKRQSTDIDPAILQFALTV